MDELSIHSSDTPSDVDPNLTSEDEVIIKIEKVQNNDNKKEKNKQNDKQEMDDDGDNILNSPIDKDNFIEDGIVIL